MGRYKFIDAPRPELFDLARDPFEETNIYRDRRTLGDIMMARAATVAKVGEQTLPARGRPSPPKSMNAWPRSATRWPKNADLQRIVRACRIRRTA